MLHSLINLNQLCSHGTILQDNPFCNDNILYRDTNIPNNYRQLYILLTPQERNILFKTQVPIHQEWDSFSHDILIL